MNGWMDGWVGEWVGEWMDGWMDGMNKYMGPSVVLDIQFTHHKKSVKLYNQRRAKEQENERTVELLNKPSRMSHRRRP